MHELRSCEQANNTPAMDSGSQVIVLATCTFSPGHNNNNPHRRIAIDDGYLEKRACRVCSQHTLLAERPLFTYRRGGYLDRLVVLAAVEKASRLPGMFSRRDRLEAGGWGAQQRDGGLFQPALIKSRAGVEGNPSFLVACCLSKPQDSIQAV